MLSDFEFFFYFVVFVDADLREKLNKIMSSEYFTTTPEMKAAVEVVVAAAGNYASFQVPVHGSVCSVEVEDRYSASVDLHASLLRRGRYKKNS